eukprot:g10797.t1
MSAMEEAARMVRPTKEDIDRMTMPAVHTLPQHANLGVSDWLGDQAQVQSTDVAPNHNEVVPGTVGNPRSLVGRQPSRLNEAYDYAVKTALWLKAAREQQQHTIISRRQRQAAEEAQEEKRTMTEKAIDAMDVDHEQRPVEAAAVTMEAVASMFETWAPFEDEGTGVNFAECVPLDEKAVAAVKSAWSADRMQDVLSTEALVFMRLPL